MYILCGLGYVGLVAASGPLAIKSTSPPFVCSLFCLLPKDVAITEYNTRQYEVEEVVVLVDLWFQAEISCY